MLNSCKHNPAAAFIFLLKLFLLFEENFFKSLDNLKQTENIYESYIDTAKKNITSKSGNNFEIDLVKLQHDPHKRTVLFELISKYGFNNKILDDILAAIDSHSGRQFFSEGYTLTKDRSKLIISRNEKNDTQQFDINQGINTIEGIGTIKLTETKTKNFKAPNNRTVFVDSSLLKFPLTLRYWHKGDKFVPFGMTGVKKLSDFFNDQKIPRPQKSKIPLLVSGNKILWIVGYRADNRFRIGPKTSKVVKIEIFDK